MADCAAGKRAGVAAALKCTLSNPHGRWRGGSAGSEVPSLTLDLNLGQVMGRLAVPAAGEGAGMAALLQCTLKNPSNEPSKTLI